MTTTRNRQTRTMITEIINADGSVTLNCDDHDRCCDFTSRNEARGFKAYPANWCAACAHQIYKMEAN